MSSSLLLQQSPACLVHLTWIVFVMGGRWPYSCCFVGCCLQVLFDITRSVYIYIYIERERERYVCNVSRKTKTMSDSMKIHKYINNKKGLQRMIFFCQCFRFQM